MSQTNILILLVLFVVNSAASLLVKKGADAIIGGAQFTQQSSSFLKSLTPALNIYTFSGLFFLGLGFVIYVILASRMQISVLQPALAGAYVFVVLGAFIFFHEPLTAQKIGGIAVIIFGVYLTSV